MQAEAASMAASDRCPKCGCDDQSMLEATTTDGVFYCFCNICAHEWSARSVRLQAEDPRLPAADSNFRLKPDATGYASIDDLIARTGVRRDELATLADIGALNALGYDRRSALWQIEKAVRPSGALFEGLADERQAAHPRASPLGGAADAARPAGASLGAQAFSPLHPMTPPERLMADYAGTSLTIGPHPIAMRRAELALRGVLRASDLARERPGRRVRVAGAVITRQRPGTAKGFVFLTLEDETGIANIIVRPDLFTEQHRAILGEPYLIIEGTLQIQEGVTAVKADRVAGLSGQGPAPQSHDFR